MAETDLERLIVSLEAQSVKLDRSIAQSAANVDKQLSAMEKRTELLRQRMEKSFANAGANSMKKFTNALLATGAIVAVERFVKSVVETATEIKHTADAIGLGTDELQAWGFAALKAGVDQETFDGGLQKFAKNVGEAQLGTGKFGKEMKALGVDLKGVDVATAFLKFADVIKNTSSTTQRAALVNDGFGRGMVKLVPLLAQGSVALRQLTADLKAQGLIISSENIAKIEEMEIKWNSLKRALTTVGANALGGFFDEFSKFAGDISSPQFQTALANFGRILADVAIAVGHIPPGLWPAIGGAIVGGRIGGVAGAVVGAVGAETAAYASTPSQTDERIYNLQNTIARMRRTNLTGASDPDLVKAQKDLAAAVEQKARELTVTVTPKATMPGAKGAGTDHTGILGTDHTKQLAAEAQARAAELAALKVDLARTQEVETNAHDRMNVILLQGLAGYHAAVIKEIDDARTAKIAAIDAEEQAQIVSLGKLKGLTKEDRDERLAIIKSISDAKRAAATVDAQIAADAASSASVTRQALVDGDKQIRQYHDETAALGLTAGAAARLAFIQATLNAAKEKDVTLTGDELTKLYAEADALGRAAQSAHDATMRMQDDVSVADELRSGLGDVAVAGLKGFKSLKDAAGNFLETLAEMVIKLYVIKPLLNMLLGESGGPLGGILGSLLGLADGGVMTSKGLAPLRKYSSGGVANSPQLAMYGEGSGPEAFVPLKSGAIPVRLSVPRNFSKQAPQINVYQTIHADRSILADDVFRQIEASKNEAIAKGSRQGASLSLRAQPARQQAFRSMGT